MSRKCEEEFNPWPSFVDIFSSVILVMLLFLLITLVNLGYYAQFKYKVSYTGSISNDDLIILNNNRSSEPNEENTTKVTDPTAGGAANSDMSLKIIDEDKQQVLLLEKQVLETSENTEKKEDTIESPGVNVADKKEFQDTIQTSLVNDDYMVVTYKGNEIFTDDKITKEIKQFLSSAMDKYPKHSILITTTDVKGQISATIAKQISLARTISVRNLVRKFGYEKKDVKVDLLKDINIKEDIDDKNGYLVIKIEK